MQELIGAILRTITGGRAAALVTPVATAGSLPTGRDARMLVFADGASLGTVGGGRLEAEAQQAAHKTIGEGRPRLLHMALTAADALADGSLCGGQVTFFIEPLKGAEAAPFTALERLQTNRLPGVEAIRLLEGQQVRRLVAGVDGTVVGTLGSTALDQAVLAQLGEVIAADRAQLEEMQTDEEQVQVFVQALQPRPTVFIFGGGHVGLALARLVPTVGMRLAVLDDRPEFCNPDRFPMADELHVRDFSAALEGLEIGPLSYLVVMTRGHQADHQVVARALRQNAGYLGMIGSRRKIALLWEALKKEGFTDADLARVHAPIGLKIGGDSPGEIAISVMAELIMVRHQKATSGQSAVAE